MIHRPHTRDELRAIPSGCTLVVSRELTRSPFSSMFVLWPELVKRAARDNDARLDTQSPLR